MARFGRTRRSRSGRSPSRRMPAPPRRAPRPGPFRPRHPVAASPPPVEQGPVAPSRTSVPASAPGSSSERRPSRAGAQGSVRRMSARRSGPWSGSGSPGSWRRRAAASRPRGRVGDRSWGCESHRGTAPTARRREGASVNSLRLTSRRSGSGARSVKNPPSSPDPATPRSAGAAPAPCRPARAHGGDRSAM